MSLHDFIVYGIAAFTVGLILALINGKRVTIQKFVIVVTFCIGLATMAVLVWLVVRGLVGIN